MGCHQLTPGLLVASILLTMTVIDIESSGLLPSKHALLSIGAFHYETGAEFYAECRAHYGAILDPVALAVNGFTVEQADDPIKPSAERIVADFTEWAKGFGQTEGIVLAGQQVGSFDIPFLSEYAGGKIAFERVFSRRSVDLHSVAYARFGKSLSLDGILQAVGLAPEPKPHNALTGARLEAAAFRVLLAK